MAMYAEIEHRKQQNRHRSLFREPAFLNLNRQVREECCGLWWEDVIVWEEVCNTNDEDDGDGDGRRKWKVLGMQDVKDMCVAKSMAGQARLVTQPAYCNLGRMREGVEASRSICPRKGLMRVRCGEGIGGLRWWVW